MVFWIEGIQIYDYCITPGSPDIHQFYVQNWLYWGFPTGISNRRYSNYCLSPGIARLEHDLKMLLTIGCMFFPSVVRCFGISIIFHLKTAFLRPLLCPAYEGPKPSQKSIIFYLKTVFPCIWDLSNSWGYKWISSIWKPFGGTLWVPSWNNIFYLKSVFQYSSNIFYLKNKLHYRLSSIWKVVWITIPQSKN